MDQVKSSVVISVHQHYGFKPWLAKITGTHPKYGFERTFVNPDEKNMSKSGATGSKTWIIVYPGLYQLGGTKRDNEFFVVDENFNRTVVSTVEAKKIVRGLD